MDLTGIVTMVFALSILVERLIEATFSMAELWFPRFKGDAQSENAEERQRAERYPAVKRVASTVLGIVLGIAAAAVLGIRAFAELGITGVSSGADSLLTGAIAGALAPYSHQLIEGFFDLRVLLKSYAEGKKPASEA